MICRAIGYAATPSQCAYGTLVSRLRSPKEGVGLRFNVGSARQNRGKGCSLTNCYYLG